MIFKWFLWFIPALVVEALAWLLTPFVCLFVVKKQHNDVVKRVYKKKKVTLLREFLPKWLNLFNTPDNAVDEYWYGMYNEDSWFKSLRACTQAKYDSSWWLRYWMRCMWLFRNTAYGWHYWLFSLPEKPVLKTIEHGVEGEGFWYQLRKRENSFQLEYQIPIVFTKRYIHGNIGWKGHRGDDLALVMYANRIIGMRKYK